MLLVLISNLIMHSILFYCLRGVQNHMPHSTPLLRIFCFLTQSIKFAVIRFVFKIKRFSFLHHQVSSLSAGYLFVEEMAKQKLIVLPKTWNNTFLKVIYGVHFDLRLDYALNLVFMSTRGTRSYSRLDPLLQIICFLTRSIRYAVILFVFKTKRFSFFHHQVSSRSVG